MAYSSDNYKGIWIPRSEFNEFEYLYPDLCKSFIRKAMKLAVQNRQEFEHIFFKPTKHPRHKRIKKPHI